MKHFLFFSCLMLSNTAFAQDSIRFELEKGLGLIAGYSYNFAKWDEQDIVEKKYHFIELGIWKTSFIRAHHPITTSYYFSNEVGLNTSSFVYGPKFGGFVSVMVLGGGGEFVYYTNFRESSLRFVPYLGLCTYLFKLTLHPHIIITNKAFEGLNPGHLNLTMQFASLKRSIKNSRITSYGRNKP